MSRCKNKVFDFVTLGHYQFVLTSDGKYAYGVRLHAHVGVCVGVCVKVSGSKPGLRGFPTSSV